MPEFCNLREDGFAAERFSQLSSCNDVSSSNSPWDVLRDLKKMSEQLFSFAWIFSYQAVYVQMGSMLATGLALTEAYIFTQKK